MNFDRSRPSGPGGAAPRRLISYLLLLLALSGGAGAQTLEFRLRGQPVATLSLEELQRRSGASRELKLFEPHEGRERSYKAIPLKPLLRSVYDSRFDPEAELLISCLDGYQPSVPGPFLEAHEPYLAFASADGEPFTLKAGHAKGIVEAGPYYLVWSNLDDPGLKKDDVHYWPYQVSGIDLIDFGARFPRMTPPEGASRQALRGFALFRSQCVMCHSINGDGGAILELNYPVSVTEYWQPAMLRRWILGPESIRYRTNMPGLAPDRPDREQAVDDLIEYLKAMAGRKQAPPADDASCP